MARCRAQLFFTTAKPFSDLRRSVAEMVLFLRKPTAADFSRLSQNHNMWPLSATGFPNPIVVIFFVSFTLTALWIMANLYRAVIIVEYSKVVRKFVDRAPDDLTNEAWPQFNLIETWRTSRAAVKMSLLQRVMQRRHKSEWHRLLEAQKHKQRELLKVDPFAKKARGWSVHDKRDAKTERLHAHMSQRKERLARLRRRAKIFRRNKDQELRVAAGEGLKDAEKVVVGGVKDAEKVVAVVSEGR